MRRSQSNPSFSCRLTFGARREKNRIPRLVVLLLFLGLFVCDARAKPKAKDYLKRGDVQLAKNNLSAAIISYTKAIELDPYLAEAYIRRGMARRVKGSLNGAIQDFERAQEIDPQITANNRQIADSYSNRGFIEMGELQIESAIADFTKAIQFYRYPNHYYRRGQVRLIEEDLQGAIEDFNQALSLNPQNDFLTSMIYVNRGYALLLQGKEKDSEADFRRSLRLHNGQRIILELHLKSIEAQIEELRQRRIEARRNIS